MFRRRKRRRRRLLLLIVLLIVLLLLPLFLLLLLLLSVVLLCVVTTAPYVPRSLDVGRDHTYRATDRSCRTGQYIATDPRPEPARAEPHPVVRAPPEAAAPPTESAVSVRLVQHLHRGTLERSRSDVFELLEGRGV